MNEKILWAICILTLTVLWYGSIVYALDSNHDSTCLEPSQVDFIDEVVELCDVLNLEGISTEVDDQYIRLDCLKGMVK